MLHKFFAKALLHITLILGVSLTVATPTKTYAEEATVDYKKVAIRVVKRGAYWFRILDTGALVVLSIEEASALGLSGIETTEHVITVVAYDVWRDVEDISSAARYVAVDLAYPSAVRAYDYTNDTMIPNASDLAGQAYAYTQETIIPNTSELAGQIYEYTADEVIPSTSSYLSEKADSIGSLASETWRNWMD
jgi:hypothetical protein